MGLAYSLNYFLYNDLDAIALHSSAIPLDFQDSCSLRSEYLMRVASLTTWNENGNRAIRESPLREVGRGLFSEESLMSVATDTTKHEKDDGLSVAPRLIAGAGNWIPAPYRGTG